MRAPQSETRPRGEETRQALLDAGIALFADLGYHGTSSRALAQEASVNQALIGYHFGGKRGLYVAVFEHVADQIGARLGPAAREIQALLARNETDEETLLAALFAVLDRYVDLFTSPETENWAALIVREQQHPTEAFEVLWQRLISPMLDAVGRLVGTLLQRPPRSRHVKLLVFTLLGQTLVFRIAHAAVLHALDRDELGPRDVAAIKRQVRQNALAILAQERES